MIFIFKLLTVRFCQQNLILRTLELYLDKTAKIEDEKASLWKIEDTFEEKVREKIVVSI